MMYGGSGERCTIVCLPVPAPPGNCFYLHANLRKPGCASHLCVHFVLNCFQTSGYFCAVLLVEQKNGLDDSVAAAGTACLHPVEAEVVDLFVQLCRMLGQPCSFGEIYGLLFISPAPLAMDDLMERLNLSKGSASQGLKFLRNLGAVRPVEIAGERRVHYEAVAELRNLAGSFLREAIEPRLGDGEQRLSRLTDMLKDLPSGRRTHASQRLALLRSWSKNSRRVLPLVLRVLGG